MNEFFFFLFSICKYSQQCELQRWPVSTPGSNSATAWKSSSKEKSSPTLWKPAILSSKPTSSPGSPRNCPQVSISSIILNSYYSLLILLFSNLLMILLISLIIVQFSDLFISLFISLIIVSFSSLVII